MDERVERSAAAVFDVGNEVDARTRRPPSLVPVSHRSRTIARLELREPADGVPESGTPRRKIGRHDPGTDPSPRSVCVMDVDLEELLASIEAAIGEAGAIYSFDDCELHTGTRSLTRSGHPVHLRPKVYRLLVHLIEQRRRAVSRDELCDVVWNGRCVGNATVDSTVKTLRRAAGDDGVVQRVVRTLSGYGYRFVADVEVRTAEDGMPHAMSSASSGRERLRIRLDDPRSCKRVA